MNINTRTATPSRETASAPTPEAHSTSANRLAGIYPRRLQFLRQPHRREPLRARATRSPSTPGIRTRVGQRQRCRAQQHLRQHELGIDLVGGSENAAGRDSQDGGTVTSQRRHELPRSSRRPRNRRGSVTVDFDLDVAAGDYRIELFTNPSGRRPVRLRRGRVLGRLGTVTHPGRERLLQRTTAGTIGDNWPPQPRCRPALYTVRRRSSPPQQRPPRRTTRRLRPMTPARPATSAWPSTCWPTTRTPIWMFSRLAP